MAQSFVNETGGDLSRFHATAHLPGPDSPPRSTTRPDELARPAAGTGDKWLSTILIEAPESVCRMHVKNYLAE